MASSSTGLREDWGGPEVTGDELRRWPELGLVGPVARGHETEGKKRGNERNLTGSAVEGLDGSGRRCGRRIERSSPAVED